MTGIVIQARMGSTRLPGKILMDFCGKTLLGHILTRVQKLGNEAQVVIATTRLAQDDIVEAFCHGQNVACFRGEETNVLKRYYDCAVKYGFSNVVRMTGDNPLPDMQELARLLKLHYVRKNDFTECFSVLPIGVGMEVFTLRALERSLSHARMPHHFEHVDEYILENPHLFQTGILEVPSPKRHPEIRLTVDTPQDYKKLCQLIQLGGENITTEEAIALCLPFV